MQATKASTNERIPILLDTDIGSDIDDAVALGYLLRQPRCELVGITTVSGRPRERAALADAVCRAAGRDDVPIHSGLDHGMAKGIVQPECRQANILPRFAHRSPGEFASNTAVDFLRERIRERPGEITLLAIGPMTNLGVLFSLDPEIPKLLKRLVLMCGCFTAKGGVVCAEWNALCDPVASAIVYAAPVDHLSIGLDVTLHCKLPAKECIQRFAALGGPHAVVSAMTETWSEAAEKVTFHDPLAAGVIFDSTLCEYESGKVDIELQSDRIKGFTHFDTRVDQKPHRIATEVNANRFFEHYFSVCSG